MPLSRIRLARWAFSFFTLAATVAFAQVPAGFKNDPEVMRKVIAQVAAAVREKNSRTPAMRKMSQDLIFTVRTARGENMRKGLPNLRLPQIARRDGTVEVEFTATITPLLLRQLVALGAKIEGVYPTYRSLSARIPIRSLEPAALLTGVGYIKSPSQWATDAGNVQSEGDKSMRTNELRTTFGLSGAGVKMGVLSDSNLYQEDSQASGDLPPTIQVLAGQDGRPGHGEGTAMMELIYDVAPGISLAFAQGGPGQAGFAQNYRDLFAAGCTVLSDDIFYFDEPAFQDGPIADAVNDIYTAGGIVFSSAGNAGNLRSNTSGTWEGDYVDSGATYDYTGDGVLLGSIHAWSGSDVFNDVKTVGSGVASLQWNDPWNNAGTDFDLFIYDPVSQSIVYYSENSNGADVPPIELCNCPTIGLQPFAVLFSGPGRVLRLNQIRGSLKYATGGQTWGHNSAANGIGVAAINAATSPQRAFTAADATTYYSSDGYRRIYFDENGVLIAPNLTLAGALIRNRPVVAGPDGTMTTVPGFKPFYGTSAATPHVAALAALLREFAPDATPAQIRDAITAGAIDILVAGFDKDSGAGAVSGRGSIKRLLETKTLGISPNPATVAGTTAANLTVNLGRNAPPTGLLLNVSATGATANFTLPSTVTVPAGASTKTFSVGASGTGTGSIVLTLTEPYTGAVLGTATVNRTVGGVTISSITLDRADAVGGAKNAVATVTLSGAAPSSFAFDIQSSNPAAASTPASTAVSTGATTRNFTVTTHPVVSDTTVTIGVRKQGSADAWTETTLIVKAPKPNSCVPSPTSGVAGTVVTFTLKLDGPAPTGGLKIGLTTTDNTIIAVPSSVTFAPGESQKSFTATAGASQVKKVVTVSIRYQLQTWAQGKFLFLVPEVSALALAPNPVKGGLNVTGTITLVSPAGPGGVLVPIAHYGTGLSHPASVVVPAGATQKTFTITTTAVAAKKTNKVYVKTGNVTKTVTLTVTP